MFTSRTLASLQRVLPYTEAGLIAYTRDLPCKVISLDGVPYMTRWCLSGRLNGAGDGSEQSEYIHCIHREDYDRDLHNHPWRWALSHILVGGYVEDTLHERREHTAGDWNLITSSTFHRINELTRSPTWTYFVAGPRVGAWGFLRDGIYYTGDPE